MTFTEFVFSIMGDRDWKEVTVVAKGSKNVCCVWISCDPMNGIIEITRKKA